MKGIFKILAYIIFILGGLYSLITSLWTITYLYGSRYLIGAIILAPLLIVFFPWYLGLAFSEWSLLLITYGGGFIGWIFYSLGKNPKKKKKSSPV
jgi:hypothetical protein